MDQFINISNKAKDSISKGETTQNKAREIGEWKIQKRKDIKFIVRKYILHLIGDSDLEERKDRGNIWRENE